MTLTRIQLKRLAKEARKLSAECLTNGPAMIDSWCGCAIGISLRRAALLPAKLMEQHYLGCQMESVLDPHGPQGIMGILSEATRERTYRGNPTAVVFPLLAWADELEAAARSAPEKSP